MHCQIIFFVKIQICRGLSMILQHSIIISADIFDSMHLQGLRNKLQKNRKIRPVIFSQNKMAAFFEDPTICSIPPLIAASFYRMKLAKVN